MVSLALAGLGLLAGSSPAVADERAVLTRTELLSGDPLKVQLVDNSAFLPSADAVPALHSIEGRLTVPVTEMQAGTSKFATYERFPGFSVDFFTDNGVLAPVDRSLIVQQGEWTLILGPGRIWSEPGDQGMSRASFPFTLGSPPGRTYSAGESHNGVATFLIGDGGVTSPLRFQVTQEIAPDGDIYDMWGSAPLTYQPGSIPGLSAIRAELRQEIADRLPVRPWSDLEATYDASRIGTLTGDLPAESISAAGVVVDGVIYLQPSRTRWGEYPYPTQMQHGVMSISKSIGNGIAMLWLAQEYGPEVFDARIVDYLSVNVDHSGWDTVTFGDALDMATGIGDNSPTRERFDIYANESGGSYLAFYFGMTAQEKLDAALGEKDYPWGPGEVFRYTSAQSFVLSAALDAYLKSKQGPDAHLWEALNEAVFKPIGVHHLTMIEVPDGTSGPGIPFMASGLRLTVDDLGKIVTLLQNGGAQDGQQLLNAELVKKALYRTGKVEGLPTGRGFADGDQAYQMSFWSLPYRADGGGYFQVPFMAGAGGNTIFLAQNGVTTFVFTEHGVDTYSLKSPWVAEAIRPFPEGGLRSVNLLGPSLVITVLARSGVVLAAVLVLVGGFLLLRRRLRAR